MPNPSSGVSPDLGARLREVRTCPHHHSSVSRALWFADSCDECLSLVVAAIRAETLLEAARIAEGEYGSEDDSQYNLGYEAAARYIERQILALTGSQTPHA